MGLGKTAGVLVSVLGFALAHPALAASDVSDSPVQSNTATGSTAAKVAATQTATIIGNSASSGFSGGGFAPSGGGGGFSPSGGGGGGFSPSGGSGGGFSPSGGGGQGSGGGFSPSGGGQGQGGVGGRPGGGAKVIPITGKSGGGAAATMGAWAQGLWSTIDKSEAALKTKGDVYNAVAGFDARSQHLVGGVALGYENIDLKTLYNDGSYKANGYTVAPYGAITLTPKWTLDGAVGYTWLDYETSRQNNAVTGSFDGSRWFVSSNLTGSFAAGNWRYQPKLGAIYMMESQNAYTDSSGEAVVGSSFSIGKATGGSKVGYAFGSLLPYVKVMGEWDFDTPNAVQKSNGQLSDVSTGGAVAGLGVEYGSGRATASLEVNDNSVLREDLSVWSTVARVRWEF